CRRDRDPDAPRSVRGARHVRTISPTRTPANSIFFEPALAGGDRMQIDQLKRREFITLLGGAAVAWPLAVRAQQSDRAHRVGVLIASATADDPDGRARFTAFVQALQQLGWTEGRNVRIDIRWGMGDAERIHKYAAELVALAPDVILASGTPTVAPLLQATRT